MVNPVAAINVADPPYEKGEGQDEGVEKATGLFHYCSLTPDPLPEGEGVNETAVH